MKRMRIIMTMAIFLSAVGAAFASFLSPNEPGYRIEIVAGQPKCVQRAICNPDPNPPCLFSGSQLFRLESNGTCQTTALNLPH